MEQFIEKEKKIDPSRYYITWPESIKNDPDNNNIEEPSTTFHTLKETTTAKLENNSETETAHNLLLIQQLQAENDRLKLELNNNLEHAKKLNNRYGAFFKSELQQHSQIAFTTLDHSIGKIKTLQLLSKNIILCHDGNNNFQLWNIESKKRLLNFSADSPNCLVVIPEKNLLIKTRKITKDKTGLQVIDYIAAKYLTERESPIKDMKYLKYLDENHVLCVAENGYTIKFNLQIGLPTTCYQLANLPNKQNIFHNSRHSISTQSCNDISYFYISTIKNSHERIVKNHEERIMKSVKLGLGQSLGTIFLREISTDIVILAYQICSPRSIDGFLEIWNLSLAKQVGKTIEAGNNAQLRAYIEDSQQIEVISENQIAFTSFDPQNESFKIAYAFNNLAKAHIVNNIPRIVTIYDFQADKTFSFAIQQRHIKKIKYLGNNRLLTMSNEDNANNNNSNFNIIKIWDMSSGICLHSTTANKSYNDFVALTDDKIIAASDEGIDTFSIPLFSSDEVAEDFKSCTIM